MKKSIVFFILFALFFTHTQAQSEYFKAAQDKATNDSKNDFKCFKDPQRNIFIDNSGVIHIFIFEDGNFLLAGFPTTATERNIFQVHLYVKDDNTENYILEYTGSFTPTLNMQSDKGVVTAQIRADGSTIKIKRYDFAKIGPFTGTANITLKHKADGEETFKALLSSELKLAKIIHASIGSGIFYTSLKNPKNIKKIPLPTGDSTLNGDDVNGRGVLVIGATFYPWGRNNLFLNSSKFKDHFGLLAATSIGAGSDNFNDLFVGIQYDFSIGGSVTGGLHYGRRQNIIGVEYRDFKFGETKFTGDLELNKYMNWDVGFFIGVQIDSRIFSQVFPAR